MKKHPVIIVAFFLLLAVLLLLRLHRPFDVTEADRGGAPVIQSREIATLGSARTQALSSAEEDMALERAYAAKREKERLKDEARERREYSTPIAFFGLVLDQFERPVIAARVAYASVGGSFEGERDIFTDSQGRFAITGIQGKRLRVIVSHPEYYDIDQTHSYYVYAGNDRGPDFKPDANSPVIFRLRKKGEAAELIHRQDQVRFSGDEPERSFSLFDHSRHRDVPEYVILRRVETAERDNRGQPIRRLEMEVQDGGIQQRIDPFAFTAPDSGYQPKMHFMRPPYGGQLDYFVKFSNGNYGRFTIMGSAGDYRIDSYLNPDRSPNLEYDREKEITFVETGKMGIDLLYPAKKEAPKKQ